MKNILKPALKPVLSLFFVSLLGLTPLTYADEEDEESDVKLTYVEWSTEVASTNVVKVVLEELGYKTDIMEVTAIWMWKAVASGDVDGHVAAWLPTTHDYYFKAVQDSVENLGPNLKGTKIGLVVPSYVTIHSIDELNANAEKFGGQIRGIDPAAGLMKKTEQVMEQYNLNFQLEEGSDATMTDALADAIQKKEWIVVTGWTPHWKFSRWDLKYLDDPKGIYQPKDNREHISTIVHKSLKTDKPEVYRVLDNFEWEPADIEKLMVWNAEKDADPYENAKRWVKENPDKVKKWLE
ncbi:MAG: glycine/betaine ABC transporter substrate-binding protein [Candidatus Parabeggiatoa sp. nov. 3]|jgi:glycine betaine/proline transport system substrate-binding protein|nr:MAG: glycine/betaine ABC transporter substrate-binding protein [Gammaproteobacteria bacterium]RKZ69755.1 MAG: glycine/betaine ABC transporter substrate-binding protein [Gammaproteobacteria bacterium]RKZ89931.1 MAG: glycine/betaine ABC transporter substrate-binding protein [Gammaproteobacteria bacterium]